jgi:hypothetical protein
MSLELHKQDKLQITTAEKGESNIVIVTQRYKTSQAVPAGLSLMVKQGDTVKLIKH